MRTELDTIYIGLNNRQLNASLALQSLFFISYFLCMGYGRKCIFKKLRNRISAEAFFS